MMQWFAQEHPASCVAACLRMVSSGLGVTLPEIEIRQRLGNPRFGLTLQEAADKLLASGAIAQWHGDWGLDDLRDSLRNGDHPIVGVERRYFGHPSAAHAVVVIAVRAAEIEILDPLNGPSLQMTSLDTFMLAWRATGQEALVLATPLA